MPNHAFDCHLRVTDKNIGLLLLTFRRMSSLTENELFLRVTTPYGFVNPSKGIIPTLAWNRCPCPFIQIVRSVCIGGVFELRDSTNLMWGPKRRCAFFFLNQERIALTKSSELSDLHSTARERLYQSILSYSTTFWEEFLKPSHGTLLYRV